MGNSRQMVDCFLYKNGLVDTCKLKRNIHKAPNANDFSLSCGKSLLSREGQKFSIELPTPSSCHKQAVMHSKKDLVQLVLCSK